MVDREIRRVHGPVIARIATHADGYSVMTVEFEVPTPDLSGMFQKFLDDQRRPRNKQVAHFVEKV